MAIKIRRVRIYIPAPQDVMPQKGEDSVLPSIPWSAYIQYTINKFRGEYRKIPFTRVQQYKFQVVNETCNPVIKYSVVHALEWWTVVQMVGTKVFLL